MAKRARRTQAKKADTGKKSTAGVVIVALVAIVKPLFEMFRFAANAVFGDMTHFNRYAVGNPQLIGLASGVVIALVGWLVIRKIRPGSRYTQTNYAPKESGYSTAAPRVMRVERQPMRHVLVRPVLFMLAGLAVLLLVGLAILTIMI
ncbi:hypothetical protein [Lacticaseibacillus daqingensis]|uniref:hypothetical protein n=1 Tax=Lacticaseibacillus daqingensis TaxID=2486014 RepID=UPI000F7A78DA|nr:hypothetical protein [Lacticaseibacillus daqingensis]